MRDAIPTNKVGSSRSSSTVTDYKQARKRVSILVYAGKTGTGFNQKNSKTVAKQLRAIEIPKPALKMPGHEVG